MPNQYGAQVTDATLNPAAFALPAAASTSTSSAAIDFGLDVFKIANLELALVIPALSTTIAPDTRTVSVLLETSTVSNFASVVAQQTVVYTGAGGVGIAATETLFRLPSNAPRYARFTVTFGASTTTGAAFNATGTVRINP
jgi:hypothetical protein